MALLLNIDTSTETASISIAGNGLILATIENPIQKEHAFFLHTAIQELLSMASISIKDLDAIAVTEGPGSYTGLRVGMASAKGLAYALDKPFITIGTLKVMTRAAILQAGEPGLLYRPMVDARRMEVYTALFNDRLEQLSAPSAVILEEDAFQKELETSKLLFFGSGAAKWKILNKSKNALFLAELSLAVSMADLTFNLFSDNIFTNLANSQPLYVKEFFSGR